MAAILKITDEGGVAFWLLWSVANVPVTTNILHDLVKAFLTKIE